MSGSNAFKRFTPRKTLAAIAVGSVLMMSAPAAIAADGLGTIKGHITTDMGSNVGNAKVLIKHESKGIVKETTTGANGSFSLKGLPIGNYTITIIKDGFYQVKEQHVAVTLGNALTFDVALDSETANVERISVSGARISRVDTSSTTTSQVISMAELNQLPVELDSTAIALLTPGSVSGDDGFGGVAIGGSSVAENGYYLNGLNITDLRKGMGDIDLPWEAIAQTEVQTGGVSAEYGRFIGGVVNLVSKSGDNDWAFGAKAEIAPDGLASSSLRTKDDGSIEEVQDGYWQETEYNIWASGALIEDKLFFYGLWNPNKEEETISGESTQRDKEWDTNRWFTKLDWYMHEDHSLGIMAFSNEGDYSSTQYQRKEDGSRGDTIGLTESTYGGIGWNAQYTGYLTDDITLSAMYGEITQSTKDNSGTLDQSTYEDYRSGSYERLGDWVGFGSSETEDKRITYRIDLDWVIGDHTLRGGYDYERLEIADIYTPHGDGWYEYYAAGADNSYGLAEGTEYADLRIWGKNSQTENVHTALYISDSWAVTDTVTINAGVRYSEFSNTTGSGEKYVDLDGQYAPRLGATWDVLGDGSSKVYGSYGRYFQPVSPNTNLRMASSAYDSHIISYLDAVNADGSPVLGDEISRRTVADGTVPDADQLFNNKAGSMYSDEFALGYQQQINDDWAVGIRGVYRDLKQSIEDVSFNYGMNQWIKDNYDAETWHAGNGETSAEDYFVGGWFPTLTNPGIGTEIYYDVDGDGVKETVDVNAEQMGFPNAERTYKAIELNFSGNITEDFTINGSYTWSKSEGNTEGLVRSDNEQADPGWTTSFDYPELMDNGDGYLPNDRRHNFKLYGVYHITEDLSVGFNSYLESGRPINAFGIHPEDQGYCVQAIAIDGTCYGREWYGASSFYADGEPVSRGSMGRTEWTYNIDLNVSYTLDMESAGRLNFKLNVFNLFDFDGIKGVDEQYELDSGAQNVRYGYADSFQKPRYVRASVRYDF
ncbi:carboxypeptidase regulatory-like domain-containing protein [Shewanella benthica]|uniref:TonB-dependent receptor n=1 Tax=Shewanella benthica TaxID=43661 RepID=UPI00187A11A5|nr:carboxypeptidase regulatory-like domain-containing protein [Shewanella benthica]MBE7215441.1 carboxypeptidase regulatory-like domain-containing protein [Shewanella benthica]MCL1062351.1 carboxypeptidase regulatory-like domain-containing protein [Shewanella benthica]